MSRAPRTHAGWGAEDRRQALLNLAASTAELDEEQQRSRPGAALPHAQIPEVSLRPQLPSPLVIDYRAARPSRQQSVPIENPRVRIGGSFSFRTTVGYPDANDRLRGAASRRPRGGSNDPSRTQPSRGPPRSDCSHAPSGVDHPADEPKRNPKPLLCPRGGPGTVNGDHCQSLATGPFACRRTPASKQCQLLAHSPWCKAPASES